MLSAFHLSTQLIVHLLPYYPEIVWGFVLLSKEEKQNFSLQYFYFKTKVLTKNKALTEALSVISSYF